MRRIVLDTMIATVLTLVALLQAPTQSPAEQKANDYYQAQDWTQAAHAYGELIKSSPDSATARFRLAISLMNLGKVADAVPQLMTAEKLGTPPMQVAVRLALAHAHLGDPDKAFEQLTRATGMGLTAVPPPLAGDPAIEALRRDARFKTFETALDRNARPCEHDARYRELDFWLGEWDARNANAPPSTPPSSSVITKIHNGCVILETWRSPGYSGQSFNIFDRSRGKWHQTWVDSTGGLHEYWGQLKDGNMVYEGTIPPNPGQTGPQLTRMTFFNLAGKVRQLVEQSSDGGKTWRVAYDFLYAKKAS